MCYSPCMPIAPEILEQMTPQELAAYKVLLQREVALKSPLDLACLLFPETRRWPQLELLNDHLLALSQYRLTAAGPVPAEDVQWWYRAKGADTQILVSGPHAIPEQELVDAYGAYDGEKNQIVFQLAVSMMPRAGKSRLITEVFPLWLLLQDPDMQIGLGTYNDTFAGDWGEAMRNLLLAHHSMAEEAGESPFLPYPEGGARAAKDILKVQGFLGKIRYTGTGGTVTGKTLHVLVGDDFVKGEEDMLSDAIRFQLHRFIDSTWETRKTRNMRANCPFPIPFEIRMATRWHQMDPIGYSCFDHDTHAPDPFWCIVNIPSLAVDGPDVDPLGREVGESHPNAAGLTREALEKLRADDPRTFSSLYQGNPAIEGGGLVSTDFKSYWTREDKGATFIMWRGTPEQPGEVPPILATPDDELIHFAAADMAATKKTSSDYTVLGTFAYSREHDMLFVTSWFRDRITTDQYNEILVPLIVDNSCATTVVENVTYGQVFGQSLERLKLQVEFADAIADKVARIVASEVSGRIRKGGLRVASGASYLPNLVAEAEFFPYGDHDDQVDVLAFANDFVKELPDWRPKVEKKVPTVMDMIDEQVDAQVKKRKPRRDGYARMRR